MWEYSGSKSHVSAKEAKSLCIIPDTMSNRNTAVVSSEPRIMPGDLK